MPASIFYAPGLGVRFWPSDNADTRHGSESRRSFRRLDQSAADSPRTPRATLYVVIETGKILKWTKGTDSTTTVLVQASCQICLKGWRLLLNGQIYFSTYGRSMGDGTFLNEGAVWMLNTNGVISAIAGGFAQGMADDFGPSGNLYLTAQGPMWITGNSRRESVAVVKIDSATKVCSSTLSVS